eukprot:m.221995 g.221995  ORF g.221995 m.221995 type:complete len:352 (+) comp39970_c0_seq5:1816-2871(+)
MLLPVKAADGKFYLMLTKSNSVALKFKHFRAPCGKVTFEWKIVDGTTKTAIYSQTDSSSDSSGSVTISLFNKFTLKNAGKYMVSVAATNVRGMYSYQNSETILVDLTSPNVGRVYDGRLEKAKELSDKSYQTNRYAISAHWDPSTIYDPESGIDSEKYELSVGTYPEGNDVVGYTQTEADNGDISVRLSHAKKYFVTLRVFNKAGLASLKSSDGIVVDVTSPDIGRIYDGPRIVKNKQIDQSYQASNTRISGHWDPATIYDDESGIDANSYEMSVGSFWGRSDVIGYSPVTADHGDLQGHLVQAKKYYVTLRVFNRAGLSSSRSSDGIVVDVTIPTCDSFTILKRRKSKFK